MSNASPFFASRTAIQFCCLVLCMGVNSAWGQGRRDVIVHAPADLVWYEDVSAALEAQSEGQLVVAMDLSRQKLRSLPDDLVKLDDLTYLIVNRNRLDSFPSWLSTLSNLRVLIADHNRLAEFPEVLLDMPELQQLSLGENYLPSIPIDIDRITRLEILSLWGNVLSQFPASLGNLEHLNILDLLHNRMTKDEQDMLLELMPDVTIHMSEHCHCEFESGFSSYPTRDMP